MTTAKPTVKTPATTADTQRNNMSSSADTTDGLRQRHVSGANSQRSDIFNTQQQQYQRQFLQFAQSNGLLSAAAATMQPVANAHMSPMQAAAYLQQMQHTTPPQIALTTAATCMPPTTEFNALAANAIAAQQMAMYNAWMQQVYAQYLQQITGLNSTATAAGQSGSGEQLAAMQAYLQQQMPYMTYPNATTVIPTSNMMTAFPNLLGVNHAAHMPTATTAVNEEQQQQQQQQEQPQQPQQEVQQRRFPNIVQDEAENRDWLDSFFSITRLAIFLTVLYFNTSPLRCFIVLIIGGAIYLYHIGVLRLRTERNNNNINRNNNAAEQIRQGVQQVQAAQQEQQQQQQEQLAAAAPAAAVAAGDAVDGAGGVAAAAGDAVTDPLVPTSSDNNSDTPNEAAAAEDNASMISFIRTFVITFFTSLLPETPAL